MRRLVDAPAFHMNLACGDSLYHGRQRQQTLGDWTDESHYFHTEDAETLSRILREGTFHVVVANPPYITPKDRAANQVYRKLYPKTCHMKYSLAVPFMERVFRLAVRGGIHHGDTESTEKSGSGDAAGFTGQITASSFMKREFGKKLIEDFFPDVELSHVIDTQCVHLPGHGTSTLIVFGRNRLPLSKSVRVVSTLKNEEPKPPVPSSGKVWHSVIAQVDVPNSESEFVTVSDFEREILRAHPWSIGGGGAAELKRTLDGSSTAVLDDFVDSIGFASFPGQDEAFVADLGSLLRSHVPEQYIKQFVVGETVRDWTISRAEHAFAPYDDAYDSLKLDESSHWARRLWPMRTAIGGVVSFGGRTRLECGDEWWTWYRWIPEKYLTQLSIVFAFVATDNHFVLDRGDNVFKQSAPVIKLPSDALESDHLTLLGLLNCSTASFWMKQVFQDKGGGGIGGGISAEAWEHRFEHDGTKLSRLPLPIQPPTRAGKLDSLGSQLASSAPRRMLSGHKSSSREVRVDKLVDAGREHQDLRKAIARSQEDLDWECYRLYGLLEDDLTYPTEKPLGIQLGERAFEIVLARRMALGEVQTKWFERHGSTPITELPDHWPDDYKRLVERRIAAIETNPQIALIEQPEYKRRWNTEPWDSQVQRALRSWLLDQLESYFDFDGRMNDEEKPTSQIEICLISVAKLADIARQDEQFMEVSEVYCNDPAFDVQKLVDELVQGEHVPLLPILRYKPNGLRNRAEWEKTWELQRLEDKLHAGAVKLDEYELTDKQREDIALWQTDTPVEHRTDDRELDAILAIPVPPKYKSADFISSGGARYWSLRGKLDVSKERWVSFPHCEGPDGTLSAYYVDVQERLGGRDDPCLIPLLAGVIELLPWLRQWHHEIDPEYNQRMDEVYEGFVTEEAKALNLTIEEIKAWQPPKKASKRSRAKKA
ncbi:MAG: BREX-2 system adenine-specific DNA-methyltransferase PglX [bacterium]|nr:BREX-2 system adenine-specific DNA-methyltransferase PglX [bacterium]